MEFITTNWVEITAIIGSIVTSASLIVKLTPTPKDDAIFDKIVKVLSFLAINPKK
jgi:hypothetical protein